MKPERLSIGVHLRITCAKPQAEKLLGALQELKLLSREEPGNRTFEILRSCDHAGGFLLIEEFEDDDAVAAHRASSHFRHFKEITATLGLTIERYAPV